MVRGDPEATRSFSVVYLAGGRIIALDCVNAPRDYVRGRKMVIERATANPVMLATSAGPLADIGDLLPAIRTLT